MPDSAADPIPTVSDLITPALLEALKAEYRLSWSGIHGFEHWLRVRENGLRVAERSGANRKVVEYFAFFHDNQRLNNGHDPDHGPRASALIRAKFAGVLDLTPAELDLLCRACEGHTHERTDPDITIQTCWDADRLDLMRANIMPAKHRLCTEAAKDDRLIEWAVRRSQGRR